MNKINATVETYRRPDYDINLTFVNRWSPRSFSEKGGSLGITAELFSYFIL
ncbi:hypothetical protein [Aquibacillus salsiterrae]|uniref:Uncharacterized protein n=1 Tax=Aquibacillus salsiterrae TaxID=2950439 RepID=A0A9X3WDB4_9BACI|nr:hypothetical protein [Aquibacillus salsiterrae]MDC3415980.1 hypothetical protein [Aquibacillus salsiterrae]